MARLRGRSSINPALDIGQIEGGFTQGMGWTTTEELIWGEEGLLAARSGDDTAFDTALAVQPRCTRRSSSNRFTQRLISLTCGK